VKDKISRLNLVGEDAFVDLRRCQGFRRVQAEKAESD
jgi:hypothetical protein